MQEFTLSPTTQESKPEAVDDAKIQAIVEEIRQEIADNKILVYGKGTKDAPMCGFTIETIKFFEQFGYPFAIKNALEDPIKREILSKMTDWRTLPKIFIAGEFYGDTDVLGPMHEKGELKPLLEAAFGK